MWTRRGAWRVLFGKTKGKGSLWRPRLDRKMKIILKWTFKKWDGGHGLE
jgi:hypothetical protein